MAVARRRVNIEEGRAALATWQTVLERSETDGSDADAGAPPSRPLIATAVRYSLEEVTARAPGNSVEVRVPPFGVTQCVEGPRHTRGTPPNVIECDADTWLSLVTGRISWADAVSSHKVTASGLRADLSGLLPL
ncbi:sterol carrier family protein [Paenarthrobacter sp. RAF9]